MRLDRLIFIPVITALVGIWGFLAYITLLERDAKLKLTENQLESIVSTIAEFNELSNEFAGHTAKNSEAVTRIWRALLLYPTASIWIESKNKITAGQPPKNNPNNYVVAMAIREHFTVKAAIPIADALADWRRTVWERIMLLILISLTFLVLTWFLGRALR